MIRYYPLTTVSPYVEAIQVHGNSSSAIGLPSVSAYAEPGSISGGSWLSLDVVAALLVAAGTLILLLSTTTTQFHLTHTTQALAAEWSTRQIRTPYTYDGKALLLRRAYDRLRRSLQCPSCTPRELAEHVTSLIVFADVYEARIYGNIPVSEERITRAVQVAESIIIEEEKDGFKEDNGSNRSNSTHGRWVRGEP